MEHRWSTRKPYQCSVIVDSASQGRIAVRLRNIGMGGMFVDTGGIALPLNALVHVVINLGRTDDRRDFRLPAMVVRRHSNGAGIMFLETDGPTLGALRSALYDPAPTPARGNITSGEYAAPARYAITGK